MNTVVILSLVAGAWAAALALQWSVLRGRYRSELTVQRARHQLQQQTTSQSLERARKQIGQLQHDLSAARLQARRHTSDDAALRQSRSLAKEALQRTLDDADASRRRLPQDGFADTMPSQEFPGVDMLLR
jgi:hypothetical protein